MGTMPIGRRLRHVAWTALLALGPAATASLVASDASAQATSDRPWLGVAMDGEGQGPQGPGVRVARVVRKSPADLAGIHEGDRLLRVAGTAVQRGADVIRAVQAFAPGDKVDVAFVAQGGKEQTAHVTLAAFPSQDDMMRMDLVGAQAPAWHDVQPVSGVFPPSIGALRGRVVVLDFWATWCVPCRIVAPKLGALQARYGAQGLSVLGVSTEEVEDVALYAQRVPFHYAVAVDKHAETTRSYGVSSLPTLVVIDKRGVVRDVSIGYDPVQDARLEGMVRTLLAEATPTH